MPVPPAVPAPVAPTLLAQSVETVATPALWAVTIGAVLALLVLDFLVTRRPHEVSMREAIGWSTFYVALPLAFGAYVWSRFGATTGIEYLTGYLVEKSLSVDNLFVFLLLLSAFAVPVALQQRVLLYGIVGALVLRGVFIALGAAALESLSFAFLLFGAVLLATAAKILRDQRKGHGHAVDIDTMRSVRLVRRFLPVTPDYRGRACSCVRTACVRPRRSPWWSWPSSRRTSSSRSTRCRRLRHHRRPVPPLRHQRLRPARAGALYFVLQGGLSRLVHLGYGLAAILGFIGVTLVLHWAHGIWKGVPEIPTLASLGVIVAILALVTATSLAATRAADQEAEREPQPA